MKNRWSEKEAQGFLDRYAGAWGEDLALRAYSARLLGSEPDLVLHGGGNTSVKTPFRSLAGEHLTALCVKASGRDLSSIGPDGHIRLDLVRLQKLRSLREVPDEAMLGELLAARLESTSGTPLDGTSGTPSLETLAHAFLPGKFIDHTHADALLALSNQRGGEALVRDALGDEVSIVPYLKPGFALARAVAEAFTTAPDRKGMVWMHHGLTCWGESARESYERTIDLVSRAEAFLETRASRPLVVDAQVDEEHRWLGAVAPIVRGLLAASTGDADRPHRRTILLPLASRQVLDFLASDQGKRLALTPPLTTDHLIRTKPLPLWVDSPSAGVLPAFRRQLAAAVGAYAREYDAYVERNVSRMPSGLTRFDPLPRVVLLPGMGALCAGADARSAAIARDITAHTLRVKARVAAMPGGRYEGLAEEHLFDMEYRGMQHAKLGTRAGAEPSLAGQVALVTGAAGAIGSGICRGLLEEGCHVAATDLPGERLEGLVSELREDFGERIEGVPLDVTEAASVSEGFSSIARLWGGVDLVVINAGLALASPLATLEIPAFRRLERVNVEGTLLLLAESARHFELQATGGDIVIVSSKNVFAPGAGFGAYSATKAAAHQLGRIASLEMAPLDVRVNMVAPDAVFSERGRPSGLWQEVGPERMRARGLDEKGLQEYYRSRNLLKARVTARHVANAVIFFAARKTPTTGATIPVDGGLPDATPR